MTSAELRGRALILRQQGMGAESDRVLFSRLARTTGARAHPGLAAVARVADSMSESYMRWAEDLERAARELDTDDAARL